MIGISLARVNYGLAVVFITPLVLVLLTVPSPGHWQVADVRVVNTLLGAAIGLLATTAILPGSERGLVIERSRVALTRSAGYLGAIGHRTGPERLAARRSARAATDDLLAVADRVAAEPTALDRPYLEAASRAAAAIADLWEQEAQLALSVPAERMTPGLSRHIDVAAARVEHQARVLAGSDSPGPGGADRCLADADGDHVPDSLVRVLESVEAACADLAETAGVGPRLKGTQ